MVYYACKSSKDRQSGKQHYFNTVTLICFGESARDRGNSVALHLLGIYVIPLYKIKIVRVMGQYIERGAKRLLFILMLAVSMGVSGKNWYVSLGGNDGARGDSLETAFETPGKAIAAAGSNDTIYIGKGTYNLLQSSLSVTKNLVIIGDNQGATVLKSNGRHRVINIAGEAVESKIRVTLQSLTVTGGVFGWNVIDEEDNDSIPASAIGESGGIAILYADVSLIDVKVDDNKNIDASSARGGGISCRYSTLVLSGSSAVTNNHTEITGTGGGVFVEGEGSKLTLKGHALVKGNTAPGIRLTSGAVLDISENAVVKDNQSAEKTNIEGDSVLIPDYTIDVRLKEGTFEREGAGVYSSLSTVWLHAVPTITAGNGTYIFSGWYSDGKMIDNEPLFVFKPERDISFEGAFGRTVSSMYVFDITSNAGGIVTGGETGMYLPGAKVRLTAVPDTVKGYMLSHWMVNNADAGDASVLSLIADADKTIRAVFVPVVDTSSRMITIVKNEGGAIVGPSSGAYPKGTQLSLSARAYGGYEFKYWTVFGDSVSAERDFVFPVNASFVIGAVFELIEELPPSEPEPKPKPEEKPSSGHETGLDPVIYHNDGVLTIVNMRGWSVSVTDISGRVVREFKDGGDFYELDVPTGCYIVRASQGGRTRCFKVVR
ncbi:hypothetical protein Barb6_01058 [Bacteroidales bacterium Barb6]|nr:hypothetical protein Barb6_01058 [Bacteroidales bacterium Barb6]